MIELLHARGDEPLATLGLPRAHRLRGRPVDVLQAAARGPRDAFRHRHPRDAALPAAARQIAEQIDAGPHDHRRARLLVPARHGGDQLPQRARQDAPSIAEAIDLERRLAALLPRPQASTSSTARTTTASSGSARAVLRGRPAALHRARPLRRRAAPGGRASCARPPASCCASTSRTAREQPVRALRRAARDATCRTCSKGDAADYHAYAFATVRMVGSAFEAAASHVAVAARRERRESRRATRVSMMQPSSPDDAIVQLQGALLPPRAPARLRPQRRRSTSCRAALGAGARQRSSDLLRRSSRRAAARA